VEHLRRRYYIAGEELVHAHLDLFYTSAGITWLPLYDDAIPGDRERWIAAGKPVLINALFRHEIHQDQWHDHPEVAILPHPIYEGGVQLADHVGKPGRKFETRHIEQLAALGVTAEHTILDVEQRALARNRGMRLRSVL
jgi:hypothetical protein